MKCPICGDGHLTIDEPSIEIHCDNKQCKHTSVDYYEAFESKGTLIDDVRACKICGELMHEGFYCDGDYYCSEECMNEDPNYSYAQYLEDSQNEDNNCFWTHWY